jgi:hypothetical protein
MFRTVNYKSPEGRPLNILKSKKWPAALVAPPAGNGKVKMITGGTGSS